MSEFRLNVKKNCIKSLKAEIACSMSSLRSKYSCEILGDLSSEEFFLPTLSAVDQDLSISGVRPILRFLAEQSNGSIETEEIAERDDETLERDLIEQLRDQEHIKKERLVPYTAIIQTIEKNEGLNLANSCILTNLAVYSYLPGIQFDERVAKVINSFKSSQIFQDSIARLLDGNLHKFIDSFQISDVDVNDAMKYWKLNSEAILKKRPPVILPVDGEENVLITSALPYVNNVPHLGNIIGCVLSGDCYSRFCRLRNINSLYICGTDEYGTATETKAMEEKITPQEICDKYFKIHSQVYKWFNIDFDHFGRTTTPKQTEIAQGIFNDIHSRGYTVEKSIDQLWCGKCSRFLADRFVEGTCPSCGYEEARGDQCDSCSKLINACELKNPRCKICSDPPSIVQTTHLFLDLPQLSDKLAEFIQQQRSTGSWTTSAKSISSYWIKGGLKPRCITRDLSWGTPVPMKEYSNKVFYVWFDAPIGYLSITANYTDKWREWWTNPEAVKLVQFMAKDNVPFHTIIFPASLIASGKKYTMLSDISSIEYLNYEDKKFSKSRGIGVFGDNIQNCGISSDVFRFYLFSIRPETHDSNFMWPELIQKNNNELLNNLGNFVYRCLSFLQANFDGQLCDLSFLTDPSEQHLVSRVNVCLRNYLKLMSKQCIRDGLREVTEISRLGNQYIQHRKPWDLLKSNDTKPLAHRVVSIGANVSLLLAVLMSPFTPLASQSLISQLNAPLEICCIPDHFTPRLGGGHRIAKPSPLFTKLDPAIASSLRTQYAGTSVDQEAVRKKDKKPVEKSSKRVTLDSAICSISLSDLPQKIKEQGELVRSIKANIKSEESRLKDEVEKLLQLKARLEECSEK